MYLNVNRINVWAASLVDHPGSLAQKFTTLSKGGANLEFVVARRTPDKPDGGVVFLAPLDDATAADAGFEVAKGLHTVRIGGPDQPGVAHLVTRAIASEGLNLRGMSAAAIDRRFVIYLAFDTEADADKAVARLQRPL
jgi:predicted amino acid-binding ACT domain protein